MLTKGLPVIAIKTGFCQPKRLFWDISVAEVNLPGVKSFCVHTIAGVLIYFGVCVILFKHQDPAWPHLGYPGCCQVSWWDVLKRTLKQVVQNEHNFLATLIP